MANAGSKGKNGFVVLHFGCVEATASSEFIEKSMLLKNIGNESPHVLGGCSMLNLFKVCIGECKGDDCTSVEILLLPGSVGCCGSRRRRIVKMGVKILEGKEKLNASFPDMKVVFT